ncbi:hypothetical protein L6452_04391 [Arctium lappa]|uniref:Uncharacterized protein n=1 Tax=Arctium lappa TaxID=4217 RepID=A0ACB9FRH4_ARCLA|nr:hypothetical protein L6452_04391 [Arctium lappa]
MVYAGLFVIRSTIDMAKKVLNSAAAGWGGMDFHDIFKSFFAGSVLAWVIKLGLEGEECLEACSWQKAL